MSIDKKITMNTGWLKSASRTMRAAALALSLAYTATAAGGCLFDPHGTRTGGDGYVGQVDGGTQPTDLDHPEEDGGADGGVDGGDGGPDGGDAGCVSEPQNLPMNIYKSVEFDVNAPDLEQDILNYRLPPEAGGLTFGELFDQDYDESMGYGEHGFQDLYQNEEGLRDALANDLSDELSDLLCSPDPADVQAAATQLFQEVFDDGDDRYDFRLSGDNSVYFARAVGGDDEEREYMIMVGAVVPTDGQTPGIPTVLYLPGMTETFEWVQYYHSEGI